MKRRNAPRKPNKQTPPESAETRQKAVLPENFRSIVVDFTDDLSNTFPEYASLWVKWSSVSAASTTDEDYQRLFEYCLTVFPERFFDILYQSDDMFAPPDLSDPTNPPSNTQFLPGVDFRMLYSAEGVSASTRESIWKYLQLMLFTLVSAMKENSSFGDVAALFEGVNETDLQDKLTETMQGLSSFFQESTSTNEKATSPDGESPDTNNSNSNSNPHHEMPDPNDFHEHLKDLFQGKIGGLAKELAEEIAGDLHDILGGDGENMPNMTNTQDILKYILKHPQKMMSLVKKISAKIATKMKAGDFSQEEMMKEASEMMRKMKESGGGAAGMQEMFQNMAKQMGMGKNARMDTNAFSRMERQTSNLERMRSQLASRQEAKQKLQRDTKLKDYKVEQNADTSEFVFRINGEDAPDRSQRPVKSIDELALEIENTTSSANANTKSSSKQGKNKKKNKN